ncbi:MAG TPA: hypothetical protein VJR03_17610 [Nitrospira sp.]|nr:hypothetical protein [Nitrospira sp.]
MVLHPLTQVGVGVFVSVCISRSELVMDILSHGKRGQRQQESNQAD